MSEDIPLTEEKEVEIDEHKNNKNVEISSPEETIKIVKKIVRYRILTVVFDVLGLIFFGYGMFFDIEYFMLMGLLMFIFAIWQSVAMIRLSFKMIQENVTAIMLMGTYNQMAEVTEEMPPSFYEGRRPFEKDGKFIDVEENVEDGEEKHEGNNNNTSPIE